MLRSHHFRLLTAVYAILACLHPWPAAPVPKESEKERIEKLYGKITDPKADCQFKLLGDKLAVTLPAEKTRDLCSGMDTVPKLSRFVKGEFVVTVAVTVELPDTAKPGGTDKVPFLGGGVCLSGKDDEWVRFNSATFLGGKEWSSLVGFESPPFCTSTRGYGNGFQLSKERSPTAFLRVTRTAKLVHLAISSDGKEWNGAVRMPLKLPDECGIHLYAQHSSDKASTVTFSGFSVVPRMAGAKDDLDAWSRFGKDDE